MKLKARCGMLRPFTRPRWVLFRGITNSARFSNRLAILANSLRDFVEGFTFGLMFRGISRNVRCHAALPFLRLRLLDRLDASAPGGPAWRGSAVLWPPFSPAFERSGAKNLACADGAAMMPLQCSFASDRRNTGCKSALLRPTVSTARSDTSTSPVLALSSHRRRWRIGSDLASAARASRQSR